MFLRWLKDYRRRGLVQTPLPQASLEILDRNAVYLRQVDDETRRAVLRSIQILLVEKNWEGCGGLQLTEEHRLTVAAQVAKMTLGMGAGEPSGEYFDEVQSILIYPSVYLAKTRENMGSGVVLESQTGRLGEAWHRGPVILSWNDVLATGQRQNFARNVVIHEFAHHFDMRNGASADGFPVIEDTDLARQWESVMHSSFQQLQVACSHGQPRLLDCYGATSLAEFFAVSSEAFFEEPHALAHHWPELFQILNRFYFPGEPSD